MLVSFPHSLIPSRCYISEFLTYFLRLDLAVGLVGLLSYTVAVFLLFASRRWIHTTRRTTMKERMTDYKRKEQQWVLATHSSTGFQRRLLQVISQTYTWAEKIRRRRNFRNHDVRGENISYSDSVCPPSSHHLPSSSTSFTNTLPSNQTETKNGAIQPRIPYTHPTDMENPCSTRRGSSDTRGFVPKLCFKLALSSSASNSFALTICVNHATRKYHEGAPSSVSTRVSHFRIRVA